MRSYVRWLKAPWGGETMGGGVQQRIWVARRCGVMLIRVVAVCGIGQIFCTGSEECVYG